MIGTWVELTCLLIAHSDKDTLHSSQTIRLWSLQHYLSLLRWVIIFWLVILNEVEISVEFSTKSNLSCHPQNLIWMFVSISHQFKFFFPLLVNVNSNFYKLLFNCVKRNFLLIVLNSMYRDKCFVFNTKLWTIESRGFKVFAALKFKTRTLSRINNPVSSSNWRLRCGEVECKLNKVLKPTQWDGIELSTVRE